MKILKDWYTGKSKFRKTVKADLYNICLEMYSNASISESEMHQVVYWIEHHFELILEVFIQERCNFVKNHSELINTMEGMRYINSLVGNKVCVAVSHVRGNFSIDTLEDFIVSNNMFLSLTVGALTTQGKKDLKSYMAA